MRAGAVSCRFLLIWRRQGAADSGAAGNNNVTTLDQELTLVMALPDSRRKLLMNGTPTADRILNAPWVRPPGMIGPQPRHLLTAQRTGAFTFSPVPV